MLARSPEKPGILPLIVGFSAIILRPGPVIRRISGPGREIVLWLTDTETRQR